MSAAFRCQSHWVSTAAGYSIFFRQTSPKLLQRCSYAQRRTANDSGTIADHDAEQTSTAQSPLAQLRPCNHTSGKTFDGPGNDQRLRAPAVHTKLGLQRKRDLKPRPGDIAVLLHRIVELRSLTAMATRLPSSTSRRGSVVRR